MGSQGAVTRPTRDGRVRLPVLPHVGTDANQRALTFSCARRALCWGDRRAASGGGGLLTKASIRLGDERFLPLWNPSPPLPLADFPKESAGNRQEMRLTILLHSSVSAGVLEYTLHAFMSPDPGHQSLLCPSVTIPNSLPFSSPPVQPQKCQ